MSVPTSTPTDQQIKNFRAFQKVQMSCRYNMLDPRARAATGLTEKDYRFVIDNYDTLDRYAGEEA